MYPDSNTIVGPATTARLEPKIMAVLVALARTPREVVTREYLLDTIWANTVVTDEVVTRCISEIRQVFADRSGVPGFIQTIPKVGYRLVVTPAPLHSSSLRLTLLATLVALVSMATVYAAEQLLPYADTPYADTPHPDTPHPDTPHPDAWRSLQHDESSDRPVRRSPTSLPATALVDVGQPTRPGIDVVFAGSFDAHADRVEFSAYRVTGAGADRRVDNVGRFAVNLQPTSSNDELADIIDAILSEQFGNSRRSPGRSPLRSPLRYEANVCAGPCQPHNLPQPVNLRPIQGFAA